MDNIEETSDSNKLWWLVSRPRLRWNISEYNRHIDRLGKYREYYKKLGYPVHSEAGMIFISTPIVMLPDPIRIYNSTPTPDKYIRISRWTGE